MFNQKYPFTCKRFQTDGRSVFAMVDDEGNENLIDLVRKQQVFKKIIKPSLYSGIEYDSNNNSALRWYPLVKNRSIVLDPQFSFGRPIVADAGIATEVLHQSWLAEDEDTRLVAGLYEIDPAAVKAAVMFEQRIATREVPH
ncbi:hypothetical protein E1189_00460 [Sansalvadorimonas verongulae]|nr:hypothetical protein [Sansalvadorimonas verongulae]